MRIAIVGAGISGIGAALALNESGHEVMLFEANPRAGGHANTADIMIEGKPVSVDTGFIVYNERNYPHLTSMFAYLGVETAPSNMSFGVSENGGQFEYCTQDILGIFAQAKRIFSRNHWRMLKDIMAFNKASLLALTNGIAPNQTLGDYVDGLGLGDDFLHRYLLPMGAAIWSTPMREMRDYPAASFLRFFENHGLLTINQQPKWRTVVGGSKTYVTKALASFSGEFYPSRPVSHISRQDGKVMLKASSQIYQADAVIMACHADQAMRIISDLDSEEREWLGSFNYRPNIAVLHGDMSFMPQRKRAWAAWNVLSRKEKDRYSGTICLTYWMNRLQPLPCQQPVLVTLNPPSMPKEALIWGSYEYAHPQFTTASFAAQAIAQQMQGRGNIWYAGAWLKYGFHEDGLASGIAAAEALGGMAPWQHMLAFSGQAA